MMKKTIDDVTYYCYTKEENERLQEAKKIAKYCKQKLEFLEGVQNGV